MQRRAQLLLNACEAGIREMLKTDEGRQFFPDGAIEYQEVSFSVVTYFNDDQGHIDAYVFELSEYFIVDNVIEGAYH